MSYRLHYHDGEECHEQHEQPIEEIIVGDIVLMWVGVLLLLLISVAALWG